MCGVAFVEVMPMEVKKYCNKIYVIYDVKKLRANCRPILGDVGSFFCILCDASSIRGPPFINLFIWTS